MRIAIFIILFTWSVAQAESITGRVVAIADGDTITLLDSANQRYKIRLTGIDAPESRQSFGQVAKQHLSTLAYRKAAVADCPKQDKYGRYLCKVVIDEIDIGLAQVNAGFAWWYRKYAREQPPADREGYAAAERSAREKGIGLWRDGDPVSPEEWRRRVTARKIP